MVKKILKRKYAILLGLFIVALFTWTFLTSFPPVERLVGEINDDFYDLMLRSTLKKLPPIQNYNIAIIAIDDKSIAEQGRWPWSRKKMAKLLLQLKQLEASVVAFDIVFSESERNVASETISELNNLPVQQKDLQTGLQKLITHFDYDSQFAGALSQTESVLGYVFKADNDSIQGVIPPPFVTFTPQETKNSFITEMYGVLGSLPVLQNAAKNGGFLNSNPDVDGTLRYTNLVYLYNNGVYPSLGLEATRLYLLAEKIRLVTSEYDENLVLDGIQMDQVVVPTDEEGSLLIPYRGGPYTFPFFSATDILENRISSTDIAGKLVFVGATATGLGDLQPTPVSGEYPGIEVHATVASGILDQYFPAKPVWGRGLEFILILCLGLFGALFFPFFNATWLSIVTVASIVIWLAATTWLWINEHILLTLVFPALTVVTLAFVNMVHSYLFTSRQRKEIKSAFGQYVPQQHIDTILKSSADSLMSGESKELSVLFSDIRGFTTMSEKMTAMELKTQLNEYLTAMTGEIFKLEGTIDKYVGDMIMAFWNAPLPEINHAHKAILAGLNMQKELIEVNKSFIAKGLPDIHIGVGINTGMINVGDMGSKYRRAYTAIGDAVNLASRLEGMCRQYEVDILVGEETYKLVKDEFIFVHIDKVKVKGKLQSVDIYLPLGLANTVAPEKMAEVAQFHEALELYFKQQWSDAEEMLIKLSIEYPHFPLYKIYLERVREYIKSPPEKDWDGAYVSKNK